MAGDTMQSSYEVLFAAFRDASEAYAKLSQRPPATDAELSRDPDYQRLHRSGMIIARMGGGQAVGGAIRAMGDHQADMKRYWAGMDRW